MKTIYDLKLHEEIITGQGYIVTRVPNGWIYLNMKGNVTIAFVPYHEEFKDEKPESKCKDRKRGKQCPDCEHMEFNLNS